MSVGLFDTTNNQFAQITEIEKVNSLNPSGTSNSIEIDYGLLRISDNLGRTTIAGINTIMVQPSASSSVIVPSGDWVAGYVVNEDLVSTILKETIALQKTAIKKYNGPFRSTIYHAWNSISYDNEIWVFMGGRYIAKSDEWNCEWFAISQDFSVATTGVTRDNK